MRFSPSAVPPKRQAEGPGGVASTGRQQGLFFAYPVDLPPTTEGTIEGYVRTQQGEPAPGVRVSAIGTTRISAVTGSDGSYQISVRAGRYTMACRAARKQSCGTVHEDASSR